MIPTIAAVATVNFIVMADDQGTARAVYVNDALAYARDRYDEDDHPLDVFCVLGEYSGRTIGTVELRRIKTDWLEDHTWPARADDFPAEAFVDPDA